MKALKSDKITTLPLKGGKVAFYNDGGGLYVICEPSGDDINRSYNFRYSIRGARCWLRFGRIDELTLTAARDKVLGFRAQVREGIDPRRVIDTTAAGQITLKEYFDKYKTDFVGNSEYLWTRAMSKFAKLHNRPIAEISLDEVHATIKAFWNAHPVSASRVTQYLAQVFDHARVRKLRLDNPAATKDLYALKGGVAPPRKLPKGAIQPHAALPYDDLPSFVKKLSYENTPSAQCTLFTILTGSRSQEAREARWGWLNDDNTVITIPAEYMKGKKDHLIPLATQLTELLRSLPRTSEYIFPSRSALNRDKVIHANTLTTLVNDMSDNRASLHGFRSTFRDYCADKLDAPKEVYEFCLAHRMGSAAEKAYWRSEVIEKRRVVMQAYADYATGKAPKGNVVKFRAA